jgi:hypothetical protein
MIGGRRVATMETSALSGYRNQVVEEINRIPVEYLPSVLEMVRAFRQGVTLKTAEASFEQGLREALAGEVLPVSDLWKDVEAG